MTPRVSPAVVATLKTALHETAMETFQNGKFGPLGQALIRHAGSTIAAYCFYGTFAAFAIRGIWSFFRHRTEKKEQALLNQQIRSTFRQVSQMSQQLEEIQFKLNSLKQEKPVSNQAPVLQPQNYPVQQAYYGPQYGYPQYALARPGW